MSKLINKNTILYIKHGYVLYGLKGLDLSQFEDQYSNVNNIRYLYNNLYGRDLPKEYVQRQFDNFLKENFVKTSDSLYFKKGSRQAKDYLFKNRLKQDPTYKDYWRDPETGQLYKKVTNTTYISQPGAPGSAYSYEDYIKIDKDIVDPYGNVLLYAKPTANSNNNDPDDRIAELDEIKGPALPHTYENGEVYYYELKDKDGKDRWAARYVNPTNGLNAGWYWVAEGSTGYSQEGKHNIYRNGKWVPYPEDSDKQKSPDKAKSAVAKPSVAASDAAKPTTAADDAATNDSGSLVNYFDPLVTDPRTILRSTRLEKPATTVTKPKTTLRVLPKAVARPDNMPLMNRSDVRYTISDITGGSPYGSSDIELVNSLASTSDKNIFKQALMNRLKMSKWDNEVALNRLNSLGIKGHIGGNDRKRLRNLINKGTTINGKIRS